MPLFLCRLFREIVFFLGGGGGKRVGSKLNYCFPVQKRKLLETTEEVREITYSRCVIKFSVLPVMVKPQEVEWTQVLPCWMPRPLCPAPSLHTAQFRRKFASAKCWAGDVACECSLSILRPLASSERWWDLMLLISPDRFRKSPSTPESPSARPEPQSPGSTHLRP